MYRSDLVELTINQIAIALNLSNLTANHFFDRDIVLAENKCDRFTQSKKDVYLFKT